MSEKLKELSENYQKLLNSMSKSDIKDHAVIAEIVSKLRLINHEIDNLDTKINDLNLEILKGSVDLTDSDKEDLNLLNYTENAFKACSPVVLSYILFQQYNKNLPYF